MWLSVVALALAADPSADAAAAFKKMEQPILKCKTFSAGLEVAIEPGKDATMKGRILIGPDRKVRVELDGTIGGKAGKVVMVSNGTNMRMINDDKPGKDEDPPKELGEVARAAVSRSGVFTALFLAIDFREDGTPPEAFNLEKRLAVSDLKLGKKETVGGREVQVLDYKLTVGPGKDAMAVTVWIDVKSDLPVKRVVKFKEGKETVTVTESYLKAALDGKVDDKEFELPK